MQSRSTLRAARAAIAVLALFSLSGALVSAPATVAAAAAQEDPLSRERLMEEVRRRHDVGDSQGIGTLLRQNPKNTVIWVYELNDLYSQSPNEERAREMDMLRAGWRRAYQSDFFENLERYFARLNSEMRRQRATLRPRFDQLVPEFVRILDTSKTQSAQRTAEAQALSADFAKLAESFREVGDLYHVSNALYYAGYLIDVALIANDTEPAKALVLFQGALEARKAIDLNDPVASDLTKEVQRIQDLLTKMGVSADEIPGLTAQEAPSKLPGVQIGAATASKGNFEIVPKIDAFERLGYAHDDVTVLWQIAMTGADGTSVHFPAMRDHGPTLRRTGASAAEVVGVDGHAAPIPMTGRVELVRTTVGTAENPRPWAFLVRLPTEKEPYQGFELNFGPSQTQLSLCLGPASGMRHTVGGVPLLVLDENLDGVFGNVPHSWGYFGLPEGDYEHDFDAVVIGKSRRAVPFSELMNVEGKWYHLEIADDGTTLNWAPATLRTGKVQLDVKGVTPQSVIVRGTGAFEKCVFDLAAYRGTFELPIGRWQVVQGVVRQGRRQEVVKSLFLGDPSRTVLEVMPDGVAKLELGAPFDIVAKTSADETTLRITGNSMAVMGRGGERYVRLWGCVLRPEVSYRRAGTKRASKPQKMPYLVDQSGLEKHGVAATWFPLDLEVTHGLGSAEVECQFTEKKHALFGNIEGEWR